MDLARLKALIDLVSSSQISELEIVEGQERVRIVRASSPAPAPAAGLRRPQDAPRRASDSQSQIAAPAAPAVAAAPREAAAASSVVKAPMFGVFHRTPSRDAAPFVNVGDKVAVGQKLCAIEAMKVFNIIEADHAGKITAVLVEDGQEVEAGQPLFRIE